MSKFGFNNLQLSDFADITKVDDNFKKIEEKAITNESIMDAPTASLIFLAAHPVGSIYMSASKENPGTLFGGSWISWGSGRVPVGVNTNDTDFNTVEKEAGAKTHTLTVAQMPTHTHEQKPHWLP